MLRALLAAVVLAGALAPAAAQAPASRNDSGRNSTLQAIPALQARVIDTTGTLTAGQQAELEQKLAAFEQRKGAQIALLIVASTQPESIEQYAFRVVESWRLGRAASDDGVLLLVALQDRALRIEVGDGLEGVLPDAIAHRIGEETIKPLFRQQDIYGGVNAGLMRIMQVVDGEPLPPPDRRWRQPADRIGSLLPMLFLGVLVGGSVLRALLGRPLGALATGGAVGGVVWTLSQIVGASIGAGVLAFLFTLLMGSGKPRGGRGGWPGGLGSGGRGGSRSSGGLGGFRGGGGRFSGGGASVRW